LFTIIYCYVTRMKNFFNKLSTRIAVGTVVLAATLGLGAFAFAAPTGPITPASGASAVSIDTTSAPGGTGAYTSLSGPVITESATGTIALGVHTLTLPSGWEFDTSLSNSITIAVGGATELGLSAQQVTPSATALSFNVNATSVTGPGSLTFSGIKVRPTGTTTPTTGNITLTTGVIAGVDGTTNFGTLTTVAGTVTKLAFTVQPSATTTYGSSFATSPVVKTQDQFGNNSISGLPSNRTVTLTLSSGSGAIVSGVTTLDIGTAAGNGTVTFSGIKVDDVGTGKVLTADDATLTSAVSSSFVINPKPVSATISADNKVYDGNTTATISGASIASVIEFGDTLSVDTTGYAATFATSSVGNGISVSVTGLALTGATTKYSLAATSTGSANITKKTVTITPNSAQTKVYGAIDPTFTYTTSGLVGADVATGTLSRAAGESVATYAITLGSVTSGTNYDTVLAAAPVTFSIITRPITVTATTNSKEYDRTTTAAAVPTITSGTLAFSDTANFIETYDDKTAVTGKTLTPSGTVTSSNPGTNYNVTFVATTTGVITKKPLSVSAGLVVTPKNYDGNTSATVTGAAGVLGVIAGDSVGATIGLGGEVYSTSTVGTHNVTGTLFTISGTDAGNYSATPIVLTGVINPKPITVTPNAAQTKVYGGTNPTYTYTNTALVGTDSLSGSLSRVIGENVGSYTITLGTVAASSNYTVTLDPTPVTFGITTKPITVTASSTQSKVYSNSSATDPVFTYSVSPALVGTDAFTGTLSRVAGEIVGVYAIATGTLSAGTNYAMTFNSNNFTIVKATPVITWAAPTGIVYGTLLSPTQLNASPSTPGAFVYTPASSTLLNAGNGQLLSTAFTPTDTINYNGATATTSINVAKATPVITWATPAPIPAGTALSGTQLNASPSTPGAFVYSPASGYTGFTTVGTYTLSTAFTPTDTANYNSVATTSVSITIVPASIAQFTLATTTSDVSAPSVVTVTGKDAYGNIVTNDSSTVVSFTPVNASSISDFFKTLVSGVATTSVSKATAGYAQINTYVNGNGAVTPKAATLTFTDASDRTAPVISAIATNKASYEATNDTTITVTVTEDNTANTVTVNGNTATETTSSSGIWTVTFTKSSSVGTQSLIVVATDISGNASTRESSYNVVANVTIASVPTVTLSGVAIQSAYSQTQANARFATGVQFNTTNAATTTVNGVVVASGATTTAASFASSTTLGVHTYNVVVTSSTGATANITVSYQVNADSVVPVLPTITLSGSAIAPLYSASQAATRFPSGLQFTTTNGATTTVNGTIIASGATTTAASSASSTSVGVHTYNVVVTSSTGHTAEVTVSYQVNPDAVVAVTPTVTLSGAAITSAYSATAAAARFASGLLFTTTNASSVTVNGSSVTAGATITADSLAGATTLGAHTYNVIVTSSTGNTANITVSYQVNADSVTPVTPTVALSGTAITSAYSLTQAQARFTLANGLQVTTTNASAITVNGATVTPAATLTVASQSNATTLGVHTYNVVVTSSTGHTASLLVSYQVNADSVIPVNPTISLTGVTASSSYTLSQAQSRFASGIQFTTANAASVTVNGSSVTASTTVTADTLAGATTLGAHTYNVIVTSSTGNTANITVSYQVNADSVVQANGTLGVTGISTVNSTMTADNTFTNGGSWTFYVTVPTTETNLALSFGDWISGSNSIATAGNMRVYSAQSSNAAASTTAISITAANTYSSTLTLTGDLDASTAGRQVAVTVDLRVPTTTAGGSYSTNYGVKSN
jgi:hypothetical protein